MDKIARRVQRVFDRRPDIAASFASLDFDIGIDPSVDLVGYVRAAMTRFGSAQRDPATLDVQTVSVAEGNILGEYLVPAGARDDRRIVHLHGGAWIAGSPTSARSWAAGLALASGCAVFLPDYRLAPESPYPAPLDDCVAAFEWIANNGPYEKTLATVSLSGDSAGGNLAAALCVRRIGRGETLPARLGLVSAILDAKAEGKPAVYDPVSSDSSVKIAFDQYGSGAIDAADPIASPLRAKAATLASFPPTLIQVSTIEFLLHDGQRMAERLVKADVRCCLSIWPMMPHAWHYFIDDLSEAAAAVQELGRFLSDN